MTLTLEKPKVDLSTLFVPVIFANGEDDDTPGFVAAVEHARVMLDEHLYKTNEDIEIVGRTLVLTRPVYIIAHDSDGKDCEPGWLVVRCGNRGRYITVRDCTLDIRL